MGNASSTKAHVEMAQKTGTLSLANSGLSQVPDSVQKVQSTLRSLDLSGNKLNKTDSFPPWMNHTQINPPPFHVLKTLLLNNCEIEHLPQGIYSMKKLETLNVSNNRIGSLSDRISDLRSLKRLEVTNNRLQYLPESLSHCKQLEVLEAGNNKLEKLPQSLGSSGNGVNIVEINVNRNHISDIGAHLGDCPRLKTLRLEENCLSLTDNLKHLLKNSQVSLICLEGNLFTQKELDDLEEYQVYLERFTATKKKMY